MLKKLSQLTTYITKRSTVLISVVVLYYGLLNIAQALPSSQISQVYFFGDDLTDSGFNDLWSRPSRLPAGKAPTFTTFGGYTWAQYVARDIKGVILPTYSEPFHPDTLTNNTILYAPGFISSSLTGTNYAAAGSTTNAVGYKQTWAPSLHQQVEQYLSNAGQRADPNAVYFIWSGTNDVMSLLGSPASPAPTDVQLLSAANTAASNIGNEVARLSACGAKRVVVLSLPNLGLTPLITQYAQRYPNLPGQMKNLSFLFNSMMNKYLGNVIATYGTKILYLDVYDIVNDVVRETQAGRPYVIAGESFKFVNWTNPACEIEDSAIYCPSSAPNNYVYADLFHPSDRMHRVLSLLVETQIQNWS